jgi:hypothetical protein
VGGEGRSLGLEDAAVRGEQVAALHSGPAWTRADEQGEVGPVEADRRVIGHLDVLEQAERTVLQFERGALGRTQPLRDLEQPQPHLLVRSEQVSRRDAEQQRVADLSARARDGDRGGHIPSLRPILRRSTLDS